ncbi:MAG: hypothetical protein WC092_08280 [Anaerovoracaceae bacterium]
MKFYKGNEPKISDGWNLVGEVEHAADKTRWKIFMRDQKHSANWKDIKICVSGKAPNKGNYWLEMNNNTGGIGGNNDRVKMREHRPDLYRALEGIFSAGGND